MDTKSFLSSVEKKAYRTFYKDGLMDMFFGLLLIGAGFNVLRLRIGMDTSPLITLSVILLIPAFILSRLLITRPRLGYVEFGESRKKRKVIALLIAVITQLFFGFLLWTSFTGRGNDQLMQRFINPYTEFIFLVIVFSLIGYLIDYNRFYLIGFAAGIGLCLSDTFKNITTATLTASLAFGIAGLFLTISGLLLFIRFLREYPKTGITPDYEKK
jgi:hypothetical protein